MHFNLHQVQLCDSGGTSRQHGVVCYPLTNTPPSQVFIFKSAKIRGYPPKKRISVSADFKSVKNSGYPLSADIKSVENGYPLSADIKSVKKRISVFRGYQLRGKNGYPLSADINSVKKTDIRYPRISTPWKKRISVIRG